MRCVAPVSTREGLVVAIEEESLSAALEFLAVGIQEEFEQNQEVLTPRTYTKRPRDEDADGDHASATGDESDGGEAHGEDGNDADAGSASVNLGDVD